MLVSIFLAVAVLVLAIILTAMCGRESHVKLDRGRAVIVFENQGNLATPDYLWSIMVAVITGLAHFFAPVAPVWLGAIMFTVMIALILAVIAKATEKAVDPDEVVISALLIAVLTFVTLSVAWAVAENIPSSLLRCLVTALPWLAAIFAMGFILVRCFYDRAYDNVRCGDATKEAAARWRWVARIASAIVLALLIGFLAIYCGGELAKAVSAGSNTADEQPAATEDDGNVSPEELETIEALTVPPVTAEDLEMLTVTQYDGFSWEFLDSSMASQDRSRTRETGFSDALTFGFSAKDSEARFAELEEEILRNPVYGVTVANAIKDKTIGGQTIGSFNPWMEQFVNLNDQYGVSHWREKDAEGNLYVTQEYRIYAATLCTFLERLTLQGVHAWQTSENWCLSPAVANNDRKGVPASYQYTQDAFILAYVGKDVALSEGGAQPGEGLFVIGFNIHDKRPEFYGGTPENPTPSGPTTPTIPTIPDNPNPDPKPSPDPEPEPKPDPDPEPSYNKDPNKSPEENTEPDNDPGTGSSTNNGSGSTTSTADQPTNSTSYNSYTDYRNDVNELADTNQNQKTGSDPSTPSTPAPTSTTTVDNNGTTGTSTSAPINTPTPVTPPATVADSGEPISSSPGEAWGGPAD